MITKTLYLIGGPMGIGKTSVSNHLKKILPDSVFLDGDWCWDAHPFKVTEETKVMVLKNIQFLLNSFIGCSAYKNIVFCWVMHMQEIIDDILSKLDLSRCRVINVSLISSAETLRGRIWKDISEGVRSGDAMQKSLNYLPLYGRLDTVKIDTDGKTADEVAKEIAQLAY